jgi:hypothetical protein
MSRTATAARGVILLCALMLVVPVAAGAAPPTIKKSIWGPTQRGGVSQFPIYHDLGVGMYHMTIGWVDIAKRRPKRPTDPADPAYRWPAEVDFAVAEAARYGMKVSLLVMNSPKWANGGRHHRFAPRDPRDYAHFVAAASRRYPAIRHWMIWGEPSRAANYSPLVHETRDKPLTRAQRRAPRRYARMLDAAYVALKRVSRRNRVIGGNTFTTGDISPRNWIRNLRLPDGRPPRMDLYGHNPFSNRRPQLSRPPLGFGFADFSDLDTLTGWIDDSLARRGRNTRLRLFLSEFLLPTDHPNHEFNFYLTRETQAAWIADAMRISRRWSRIYTLGYLGLYDEAPRPDGLDVARGLLEYDGDRKPSYDAYRDG